jgi:DNA transposition AAA+ family ATPase
VRNFAVAIDAISLSAGEGRLMSVSGRAGRGKTITTQKWAADNNAIYLRMQTVWRTSELNFLQALCREIGLTGNPPHRKGPAFATIVEKLLPNPRTIILDEIEKLPGYFLDVIRDLSDLAATPIVLVGEDELPPMMRRNRRVWSRTYQHVVFEPIEPKDVIIYCMETTGGAVRLSAPVAAIFHAAAEGDFRIVRRDVLNLIQICNARATVEVDEATAKIAVKQALRK